jgi:hypothetical protein
MGGFPALGVGHSGTVAEDVLVIRAINYVIIAAPIGGTKSHFLRAEH